MVLYIRADYYSNVLFNNVTLLHYMIYHNFDHYCILLFNHGLFQIR